mgnify:CR=1 FL=1
MIEILNTIICYNNVAEVITYIKKVSELKDADKTAIMVVVNKIDNDTIEHLQNEIKKINILTYIYNPMQNLGYINGMLKGYEEYLKISEDTLKYVIMSNTDIDYPDINFISKLLGNRYEEEVWSIGPAVYSPNMRNYDNPVLEKRRTKRAVMKTISIFRTPILNRIYYFLAVLKSKFIKRDKGKSRIVYEIHGCYFIVRPCLAKKMLDNQFGALLYSEEAYVAENVYSSNKKTFYDSDLLVYHMEHSVTGKLDFKKFANYIADSMEVILKEFYYEK